MEVTFAYSPCPNDTFMFEPIYNGRIDTKGLQFKIVHDEVEQLNLAAYEGKYDISKLSFNAFSKVTDKYQLLHSGAALGENCGPILISKEKLDIDELNDKLIAIPGINTTANLMLSLALPKVKNKIEIVFSEIEKAIVEEKVDAGLIIHESRFTYESKGLAKILDVGEYWEDMTKTPIPLGGIAVARDMSQDLKIRINTVIKDSVAYAFANPKSGIEYIKSHAQEMEESVMYSHIGLYVNAYSKNLGKTGISSINTLIEKLIDQKIIKAPVYPLFV